jgi:L-asparaginase
MTAALDQARDVSNSGALATGRRPHVAVIATGGTIAGKADNVRSASRYQSGVIAIADICQTVPALSEIADISTDQFSNIDSKDIDLETWERLALHANRVAARPDIDGIVITHGTDTLEETAFLLHLVMKTAKPVVVTGAMRPADAISFDGAANLYDAVTAAAAKCCRAQGVLVVFDNRIHSARHVIKTSTSGVAAFSSGEHGVLGRAFDGHAIIDRHVIQPHTHSSIFSMDAGFSPVEVMLSYGGASCAALDGILSSGARGVVIAGTGNGSVSEPFARRLAAAAASGVAVVRASRIEHGYVSRTADDEAQGFVVSGSLGACKARILLMLALGLHPRMDHAALQDLFDRY